MTCELYLWIFYATCIFGRLFHLWDVVFFDCSVFHQHAHPLAVICHVWTYSGHFTRGEAGTVREQLTPGKYQANVLTSQYVWLVALVSTQNCPALKQHYSACVDLDKLLKVPVRRRLPELFQKTFSSQPMSTMMHVCVWVNKFVYECVFINVLDSRIDTLVWTYRPSSFTAAPSRAAPSTPLPNKTSKRLTLHFI